MQVSVETLSGLGRKITISVPTERVETEFNQRLRNLAKRANVKGYRPGKAPMEVVKRQNMGDLLGEVANELLRSTMFDAMSKENLVPVDYPQVELQQIEMGKDFLYSATFEVFPEVEVQELDQDKVEQVAAEIQEKDLEELLEKLREQNKVWKSVDRAVKKGDQIRFDFDGYVDDQPIEGGKAEDFELVIGSGQMIPGFEDGLIGAEIGKDFELKVSFPADYQHAPLAGKEAVFKVRVKQVEQGELPALDDAFAKNFNIEEGGIEALKADIKKNMSRELKRRVDSMNREAVFTKLLEKNVFDIPAALIEREIGNLKHEMYHRIFGPSHHDNEKIPDFPTEMFEEQAKRRVHLGLLFSEYVKKHAIKADASRVKAFIAELAEAYEDPAAFLAESEKAEQLEEIEALVIEQQVAEKILASAKPVSKKMSYQEIMNPKQDAQEDAKKEEA